MSLMLEKMEAYFNSPEGKKATEEWIKKQKIKNEILEGRLQKLEAYLQNHDFEQILQRLIKEHDDEYCDKCYKKGYEPYPNHKLSLLYTYLRENYTYIHNDLIPQDFLSACFFFKGYWFTVYCGQGCFNRIYDSQLNILMQT